MGIISEKLHELRDILYMEGLEGEIFLPKEKTLKEVGMQCRPVYKEGSEESTVEYIYLPKDEDLIFILFESGAAWDFPYENMSDEELTARNINELIDAANFMLNQIIA